jgi:hypothetical protein
MIFLQKVKIKYIALLNVEQRLQNKKSRSGIKCLNSKVELVKKDDVLGVAIPC